MENKPTRSRDIPVTETDSAITRSKKIAASLKKMRRERAGVPEDGWPLTRKRRPGETTLSRNQRMIDRYSELLALKDGKPRGIFTQLEREFEIPRQYITDKVIKPFLALVKAINRK